MTQSQLAVKLPGQTDPDFATLVSTYLKGFDSCLHLNKRTLDRKELYAWCAAHLGQQYKDWFIHEGGSKDPSWVIHIRSPKLATFFKLKYMDIIL